MSGKHSGFEALPQTGPLLEDVDVVTAADPVCQPVADLRSVTPKHEDTGTAWASLGAGDEAAGGGSVVLTSYPEGGAKAWMNELREAVSTCKDFVATSERGWKEAGK
ncbi:hypothetical protein ACIRS3_17765 [Streptomyces virginiae]|uniref:hypothetical protein n=1 Tax=Streptomyces virginiae TaxID=1961 RepID=UPI0037F96C52